MTTKTFTDFPLTGKLGMALLLVCSLLVFRSNAQNVESYYNFSSSTGSFTPAPGAIVLGVPTNDDASFTFLSIGFPFTYRGSTFTTLNVNSNGFINFGPSISSDFDVIGNPNNSNVISALNRDLQGQAGASLTVDTVGTAPNRKCIVQWLNYKKYGTYGAGDDFDFQIILSEGSNTVQIVYGPMVVNANDDYVQTGISGIAGADYITRTGSSWTASAAGTDRFDRMELSGAAFPPSGLVYTFTPIPLTYASSTVSMPNGNPTSPGYTNQLIAKLKVTVNGFVNYLPFSSLTVNTTGTTNLADITNLQVFYTADTNLFSTNRPFGSPVPSPVLSNTITDSVNLVHGDNYFWVTYDISPGATLSNVIDAAITTATIGNTARIPSVTAPVGNRLISVPMTFSDAVTGMASIDRVGAGDTMAPVLKVMVIMSSTGATVPLSQLDFNTNGTTDTSDIENLRVFFTGNSATFDAGHQFGATLPLLPGVTNFTVTGHADLANDTNYFWLTYDVKSSAPVGNEISGECTGIVIDNISHMPSVSNPAGVREIRQSYCRNFISEPRNSCSWGYTISELTTSGAITNINNVSGCPTSPTGIQIYPEHPLVVDQAQLITMTVRGASEWMGYAAWIDYNQDGDFDASEQVLMSPGNSFSYTSTFTIPCTALTGTTKMRVITQDWPLPISSPCVSPYVGEVEEYNVVIRNKPIAYTGSTTQQFAGTASPGTNDKLMLRIPVRTDGCGSGLAETFYFSTSGSTSAADITSAKLYTTGSNAVFNILTATLLGTVTSPSGGFSFAVTDTLIGNDTTNYWLTYDINPSATLLNVVDATYDSITAVGGTYIPTVTNPAGNIVITSPMTYISSMAEQATTDRTAQGSKDQPVLRMKIISSSTGAPILLTQLDFNTNGTTDTADIENISVYYTGNSSTFSTTTMFGSVLPALPGTTNFVINGSQFLANDTNYLWLTYGIRSNAIIGNEVDGELTSAVINGLSEVPSVSSPAGSRIIRQEYCSNVITSPPDACNWGYYMTEVTTAGAVVDINNPSDCSPSATGVHTYAEHPLVIRQSQKVSIAVTGSGGWQGYGAWIDFNQDGVFDNFTENVMLSPTSSGFYSATFTVPCEAIPGNTVLRVITQDWPVPIGSACASPYVGEVEEYPVTVLEYPVEYTSAEAIQQPGIVAPGTLDKPMLRIPVRTDGCGTGIVSDMFFSTAGSTAAADISAAKLYSTGTSSTFNILTATLLGTVSSPSGSFSFALADTVVNNDTTNYWLTYDISGSATLMNVVDATADSITLIGGTHVYAVTNPAGNSEIMAPMTFLGATSVQSSNDRVGEGSQNEAILKMMVIMSSTGAPVPVTSFDLTANGTTDTLDIENLSVFYTGNDPSFNTSTKFGSSLPLLPGTMNFTITGNQFLTNDTNYFWLAYDIKSGATIGNVVDGEFTSVSVDGAAMTPTETNPAGSREIRQPYCATTVGEPYYSCLDHYYIESFSTTGAVVDINNTGSGCSSSPSGVASYPNHPLVVKKAQTVSINITGGVEWMGYAAWIDYNQDGVFDNVTERIMMSPGNNMNYSATFTVPCDATPGKTVMRVITQDWPLPISSACTSPYYGEVEHYDVTILENPVSYTTSTAIQQTGSVAGGTVDKPMLMIPVRADGCGDGIVTQMFFSTSGSTAAADITEARLYTTGTATIFNNSNLLGSVMSPSGSFSFAISDTLINNASKNYWLVYDISASAAVGNVVDATYDSITAGATYIPAVTNPAGNSEILNPMTYLGSAADHPFVSAVEEGSADNKILRLMIVTSSAGAPIPVTQLDFDVNGTTDTADIENIKVWYTGNSATFQSAIQYGTTLPVLTGTTAFNITGHQFLANDTNYFWLTYDVRSGATLGNVIDAEWLSGVIDGISHVPSVSAPAGNREIRARYCTSMANNTGDEEIWNVTFGTLNNSSDCNTTGGPGSVLNRYSNYTHLPAPAIYRGSITPISVTKGSCGGFYGEAFSVFIDFNQDGDFDDPGETAYVDPYSTGFAGEVRTGNVVIPSTADLGETRMRIVYSEGGSVGPCASYGWGETEEYTINIIPEPAPSTYTWNNPAGGNFNTPTNWTPNRTMVFASDKLLFNMGGTVTVSNLPNQNISVLEVTNGSVVKMTSTGARTLIVADTLIFGTGSYMVNGSDVTIALGKDTTHTGTIVAAAGTGISGAVKRWQNALMTTVYFPLVDPVGRNREVTLNYSTAPATSGSITAGFRRVPVESQGLPLSDGAITVTKTSPEGYWSVVRSNGLVGGQYDLSYTAAGFGFISDYLQTIVVYRPDVFSSWSLNGSHAVTTGSNAIPVLYRTGLTDYGQFGLAADSSVNALPVTLVKFTAVRAKGNVNTSWTTVSEINNKGFEVQVSVNGRSFETAGFVKGAGNSSTKADYSFVHADAFRKYNANVLYYRLMQVDNDGTKAYSATVMVSAGDAALVQSMYPNPFNDKVTIAVEAAEAASMNIAVRDLQGRVVLSAPASLEKGSNEIMLNLSGLARGAYFITTDLGGESLTYKLIKSE
jgi:hypothetical protein